MAIMTPNDVEFSFLSFKALFGSTAKTLTSVEVAWFEDSKSSPHVLTQDTCLHASHQLQPCTDCMILVATAAMHCTQFVDQVFTTMLRVNSDCTR